MLNFNDGASAIDEPKTARMEQRTKPHIKSTIQRAATLLGVDETTFVTNAALERAQATIADHERSILSNEDRDLVLAALETPAAPTDALREAMAMHDARVSRSFVYLTVVMDWHSRLMGRRRCDGCTIPIQETQDHGKYHRKQR